MAKETTQPEISVRISDEQLLLHRWRYREARRAGMSMRDAKLFASSSIDIEEMRRVAASGYPADQLLRYLLD